MKKIVFTIYIILLAVISSNAQCLKGVITDSNGEPVRYATVYVNELKHGTTSNIKGEYEIKLKPGSYTVFFQSLGFSPEVKSITIGQADKIMNITLSIQYYQIPEVRVTATGEDPAYGIMRKAIGLAPYHLNRVKHYEADVYIKGSVVVNKLPRLITRNIEKEDVEIREGDSYLIESINKIEYDAPDIYRQTVIAQHSTFPEIQDSDISPMDVVRASFYQPVLADIAISPLAPNAMSHYRFSYEGSTPQGKYIVNKIKVIPKRKSQQVFEGTLYIIEDLWCLHSLDLTNENLAGSINIEQVYTPVEDDIWMPVSHNFDVKVSIVGVDADGTYGSSVTYAAVEPNTELPRPEALDLNPTAEQDILQEQREASKTQQKIEEILQKDELNNRDMSRLSRLMEKEAEESEAGEDDLEIKKTTSYTVEEDASEKGSEYWNEVRPIPLSEEEKKSIRVSDSLKLETGLKTTGSVHDSTSIAEGRSKSKFFRVMGDIFQGETWYGKNNNSRSTFGGLLDPDHFGFNSVDGFKCGIDFNYYNEWSSGKTLSLTPEFGWDFARENANWSLSGMITYNPMKQSRLVFWGGMGSKDFTNSAGISPFINMATSLLLKDNYLKLYESRFLTISQRSEYFNGFYVELRYAYDNRRLLENNTNFSLFRRDEDYSENIPFNEYLGAGGDTDADYLITNHIHHQFSTVISYIPRQRYRINEGRKSAAGSDYPTFKIYYDHGINITPDDDYHHFDHIQFEANKSKSIGAFNEYSWRFRAGGFINNEKLQFQDFNHFNIQSLPFLIRNHQDAFMLPDYYTLATPEYYIEAHFRYTTPYLLIKLLPFLSNSLMRENITLAYLYSPHTSHYYELGYGLSEIFLIGKIGVYAGFEDLSFKSAGVRFTFIFR
ncbi:MAG: carboxypeptidase-like regulatory domain-containing protein [Bacteroidales bacterium]|nr:carboxypeptidase-like regulatory domain-containing protein [Bacteroidales bacterium]